MPAQPGDAEGLSVAELAAEESAPLPDREAMSTIKIGLPGDIDNFAMPINEATAINHYTIQSYAIADADQVVLLDQDHTTS